MELPEELGAAAFFPGALGFCPACAEVPDTCTYHSIAQETEQEGMQHTTEATSGKFILI